MKRRFKLSKGQSKRNFRKGHKTHRLNSSSANMIQRGGLRL